MFSVSPSGRRTDVLVTPLTVSLREAKNSKCQPADTPRAFQSKRILRWPACVEPKNSKCQLAGSRDGGGRSVHSSGVLLRDVVCLKMYTRRRATEHKRQAEPKAARGTRRRFRSMPVFNRGFYEDHSSKTPCHWATFQSSSRVYLTKSSVVQARLHTVFASGRGSWQKKVERGEQNLTRRLLGRRRREMIYNGFPCFSRCSRLEGSKSG